MNKLIHRLLGGKSTFDRLFRINEFQALRERDGGKTILWLSAIIALTLSALAFGIGSLDNLETRMSSPYSNIIDIGISSSEARTANRLKDTLLLTDVGSKMGIDTVVMWHRFPLFFHTADLSIFSGESSTIDVKGRTMNFDGSLFKEVFKGDNIILDRSISSSDASELNYRSDGGIVVTARMLEDLGFKRRKFSEIDKLAVYDGFGAKGTYFLPVLGIVESLPSKSGFVASTHFFQRIYNPVCFKQVSAFEGNKPGNNNFDFVVPSDQKDQFSTIVENVFADKLSNVTTENLAVDYLKSLSAYRIILKAQLIEKPDYEKLIGALTESSLNWIDYNRLSISAEECKGENPQRLSFIFSRLDDIRSFTRYLYNDPWRIQLPKEVMENRENFAKVSRLGYSIGVLLLFFAIASICFFMRNLIEGHLNKVKPNLGTFKAFGLANEKMLLHYQVVLLVLLGIATVLGFLLALLLGFIINTTSVGLHFDLFSWIIPVALAIIFIFSAFFSRRVIQEILSHTPGDLVYGRD